MADASVLRTTKIGNGFVKEDVMQYLDELNTKMGELVAENEQLKKGTQKSGNEDEIRKYKNQINNLQEKLNNANNAHRTVKKELEKAQETIAQLQAGKPVPAGAVSGVDTAQLDAAKKEIENLKNQLKIAQSAQKAPVAQPANNADNAELAKLKQDLARMTGELSARAKAVEDKNREISARDMKLSQLAKENATALAKKDAELARKNAELSQKNAEIAKKDEEIKELTKKASENSPTAMVEQTMMFCSSLKETAQKEAETLTKESSEKAEKVIGDAKAEAEKTLSDAKAQAEKLVNDAKSEAEKTVSSANITAESCIKDANIKAKTTIDDANKHADTVNEMSATVRKMLLNEIDNISSKFSEIASRVTEAKDVVTEARKSIDTNASQDIKKMEAPKVDMSDVRSNAKNIKETTPDNSSKPVSDNANVVKPNNSAKPANNINPAPAPVQPKQQPKKVVGMNDMDDIMKSFSIKPPVESPAPAPVQQKPATKKPVMSMNMAGMEDLLKAVEADPDNLGE